MRFVALTILVAMLLLVGLILIAPGSRRSPEARRTAAMYQIAAFHTGIERFLADLGRVPTFTEQLDCLVAEPAGAVNWKGPYFQELPLDPWARRYLYRPLPERGTNVYQITSAGPDGVFGTADDITVPTGWTLGMAVKP